MKNLLWIILLLSSLLSCSSGTANQTIELEKICFQARDKALLEQVLELYSAESEASTAALMIEVGSFFLGTPYVAHTLETEKEQLLINLRELDCTTFAENCLAISRSIKSESPSFEQFCSELQLIRYRNGIIDGYPSRLHYFCDWIHNNAQKDLVKDMSEGLAHTSFPGEINFMSKHPDSYNQLKDSIPLVEVLAEQEKEISSRLMYYIPENSIAEVENKLMDGDIAGITTSIDGLAIQHVVILIRIDGRVHLMHASSKAEKVVISDLTLEEYLLNSKTANGIMLARPL